MKIGDFHDGDFHESHVYRLVDRKFFAPEMIQLLSGGARATYGTAGWGSITLADAVDTVLGLTCRGLDWNDGSVIGVRLLLAVPASAERTCCC